MTELWIRRRGLYQLSNELGTARSMIIPIDIRIPTNPTGDDAMVVITSIRRAVHLSMTTVHRSLASVPDRSRRMALTAGYQPIPSLHYTDDYRSDRSRCLFLTERFRIDSAAGHFSAHTGRKLCRRCETAFRL